MGMYPTKEETIKYAAENRKYKPKVLLATKLYARLKPWRGTEDEQWDKLRIYCTMMNEAYRNDVFLVRDANYHGEGCFNLATHKITMSKVSVITFMHEYAHSLGKDEHEAVKWSLCLFKRIFKKSFSNIEFEGHMARKVVKDV